ncbi:MAG: hypothetical protein KGJ08_01955 [Gammaproteobacteria bacterium]|nr:hypothetical protein [Gammaproteobacteria bacterium]
MAEEAPISLPRTLVNQLLHAAQLNSSQVHWGIISGHNGNPEHCHALNGNKLPALQAVNTLREALTLNREQVWALYCSTSGEIQVPSPGELARIRIPRFLCTSLGTKGVLQLRSWRVDDTNLRELGITISED